MYAYDQFRFVLPNFKVFIVYKIKEGYLLLHMTKSMCIAVQLRKFFFHNSQLHNERHSDKSQNP